MKCKTKKSIITQHWAFYFAYNYSNIRMTWNCNIFEIKTYYHLWYLDSQISGKTTLANHVHTDHQSGCNLLTCNMSVLVLCCHCHEWQHFYTMLQRPLFLHNAHTGPGCAMCHMTTPKWTVLGKQMWLLSSQSLAFGMHAS